MNPKTFVAHHRLKVIFAITLVALSAIFFSKHPSAAAEFLSLPEGSSASLTITPISWGTVGLDSNNVTTGPNTFPVGARVCNTGSTVATNVQSTFVWGSANPLIALRPGSVSSLSEPSIAAGACFDFYYEVEITRSASAYDTTRRFYITATADGLGTISTPTPREIYVEKLVSQNRNSVLGIKLNGANIPFGGTMNMQVGNTYTVELIASTATNGYEQIESFINLPNVIFQTLSVSSTYSAPGGYSGNKLYEDACGWNPVPGTPNYRACVGPANVPGGKAGGSLTIVYTVKVLSGGGTSQTLNTLIYDFSGSSYHYNSDFSATSVVASILPPTPTPTPTPTPSPTPTPTPSPTPCQLLITAPSALINGVEGFAYSQNVASGAPGTYVFSIGSGDLPPGLTLDPSTGAITGTPTATGTYAFSIDVVDQNGCSGNYDFSLVIASPSSLCQQQFDDVSSPGLPDGWSSVSSGSMGNWTTSIANPQTPANAAFVAAPAGPGYSELITPPYLVSPMGGQMQFAASFNLEDEGPASSVGHDGMVMEISIAGGPFEDIIAAGGSFVTGGYNKTISNDLGSPLAGRAAWSGLSGGSSSAPDYLTVTVNLPLTAYGQTIQMKWVVATDSANTAAGDPGASIDAIVGTECLTTAAEVVVSGRVLNARGLGISGASVRLTDDQGNIRTARTSSLGYYYFDAVSSGRSYVATAHSRRHRFSPRVIQLTDDLFDLDLWEIE